MVQVIEIEEGFESWRLASRALLERGEPPQRVVWRGPHAPQTSIFEACEGSRQTEGDAEALAEQAVSAPRVSKRFFFMCRRVVHHSSPQRWALCYGMLWRLTHGEPGLLDRASDPLVTRFAKMEAEVRRDNHKMKAFVRFKRTVDDDGQEHFIAWHNPDHPIVEYVAPFFADRFAGMRWTIMTPWRSVHWDGEALHFAQGAPREQAPADDELEELWKSYYASIFNPARIKLKAMQAEMPKKHWPTLPETAILTDMLRESPERMARMLADRAPTAEAFVPKQVRGLEELNRAMRRCEACDLCGLAQGAVFRARSGARACGADRGAARRSGGSPRRAVRRPSRRAARPARYSRPAWIARRVI